MSRRAGVCLSLDAWRVVCEALEDALAVCEDGDPRAGALVEVLVPCRRVLAGSGLSFDPTARGDDAVVVSRTRPSARSGAIDDAGIVTGEARAGDPPPAVGMAAAGTGRPAAVPVPTAHADALLDEALAAHLEGNPVGVSAADVAALAESLIRERAEHQLTRMQIEALTVEHMDAVSAALAAAGGTTLSAAQRRARLAGLRPAPARAVYPRGGVTR